ncbi:hypothetical protein E2C01_093621 [Portunus trituberculatus]|uniref:Uncharacterized protein n=1 Tax=Portunus trituberculatus TaxID=210409 RepID=A0A5B7JN73_PORTR|nr:hypothetical protein [Portunus trituberculatus]
MNETRESRRVEEERKKQQVLKSPHPYQINSSPSSEYSEALCSLAYNAAQFINSGLTPRTPLSLLASTLCADGEDGASAENESNRVKQIRVRDATKDSQPAWRLRANHPMESWCEFQWKRT